MITLYNKIHIPVHILRWYYLVLGLGTGGVSEDELIRLSNEGIDGLEDLLLFDACKQLSDDARELAGELYKALDRIYNKNNNNSDIYDDDDRKYYMESYMFLLGTAAKIKMVPTSEDKVSELEAAGVSVADLFMRRNFQVWLLACRDVNKMSFAAWRNLERELQQLGKDCLAGLSDKYLNLRSLINLSFMCEDNNAENDCSLSIFENDTSHIIDIAKLHSFGKVRSSKVIEFNPQSPDNLGENLIGFITGMIGGMSPEEERVFAIPVGDLPKLLETLSAFLNGAQIPLGGGVTIGFYEENVEPSVRLEFNEVEGKIIVYINEEKYIMVDMCPKPWTREYIGAQVDAKKRGFGKVRVRNIRDFSGRNQDS